MVRIDAYLIFTRPPTISPTAHEDHRDRGGARSTQRNGSEEGYRQEAQGCRGGAGPGQESGSCCYWRQARGGYRGMQIVKRIQDSGCEARGIPQGVTCPVLHTPQEVTRIS